MAAHGLVQHVQSTTHNGGHILDVVITRGDSAVSSLLVDPPSLSDHSLIVGQLESTAVVGVEEILSVRRRRWRQFDPDAFSRELQQSVSASLQSPPTDVDEWFACYDGLMRSLVDKHAPFTSVRARRRQSAPWYDADCRAAKSRLRKVEKRYRRTHTAESAAEWRQQTQTVRSLFQSKYSAHWSNAFVSCKGDTRALWSHVERLLHHHTSPSSSLTVDDFANYFRTKVGNIRKSTSGALQPVIALRSTDVLARFESVTVDEIIRLLGKSPSKQCSLDVIPTWLLKNAASQFAPLLCALCNSSLQSGKLPTSQKHALVYPRLKKASLDTGDPASYRPISNLSFISKLVERVVASRFVRHVEKNELFPPNQSAYRQHHSTETAVCIVHNDIVRAVDRGHVTAMVMLDLSAAFDTVDHQVLLEVLQNRFAVTGVTLDWFQSYLSSRTQTFEFERSQSATYPVDCSVPQGSTLGPVKFISYTEDIISIFEHHNLKHHMYADDIQLYTDIALGDVSITLQQLCDCITDVQDWCASRRLQLNDIKTDLVWFGSHANLAKLNTVNRSLLIGNVVIQPATAVRYLGVQLDSKLTLKQHVNKIASSCYYQIRRLRQISRFVSREVMMQLVSAFILSRLDYCNCILAGLPKSTLSTLQRV